MAVVSSYIERMCANALHFKEFQNDPVTGHHYTGTCGETGLATAMVCASPQIESTQDGINLMTSLTREMMSLKWADSPNGSTTTAHLRDEAHKRGFTTDESNYTVTVGDEKITRPKYISYSEPLVSDWLHGVLLEYAGVKPIILEVAAAGNLDSANGGNDERGVKYHFICVVGINKDGYVCNDGDNSAITQHLVVYSWAEIQQARPCGILMLNVSEVATVATALDVSKVSGYFTAKSDTEWFCSKTNVSVQDAILDKYRSLPGPDMTYGVLPFLGLPVADRSYVGDVCFQVFERGVLVYDPKREHDSQPGASGPCYFCHLNDPQVLKVLAPAAAPAPQPTQLSDQDQADLTLGRAFRAVVKEAA